MTVNMSVKICGIEFKTPVIAASGTFSFGQDHASFIDINKMGGIALKSITPEKREGNRPPRIAEVKYGIINSVGLQNPGVKEFKEKYLKTVEQYKTVKIINVAGRCIEDYVCVIEELSGALVDMFEINISCPNVKLGGASIGADEKTAAYYTEACKKASKKPVIVKLTPSAGDLIKVAKAVESAGADAVSLINTLPAMAVDARTKRPLLGNVTGGLSGPCIKPVALKMVFDVSRSVKIPVIGIGGIMTGTDAAEFMLCGASAVMTGTANLIDPDASLRITDELRAYAESMNIQNIALLTGALEVADE